jgi:hypothetical protein
MSELGFVCGYFGWTKQDELSVSKAEIIDHIDARIFHLKYTYILLDDYKTSLHYVFNYLYVCLFVFTTLGLSMQCNQRTIGSIDPEGCGFGHLVKAIRRPFTSVSHEMSLDECHQPALGRIAAVHRTCRPRA